MRFSALIDGDGVMIYTNLPDVDGWCRKRKGQRIEVEFRDADAIRSSQQNRFLHGPVMEEFARVWHADGWRHVVKSTSDAMPKWMVRARVMEAFCPHHAVMDPSGDVNLVRRSSADLTKAEFSQMLEEMAEYLVHKDGERGILPSPEEA